MNIKEIRRRCNLTQDQFAKKIGVSLRTVQNWEKGGVIPASSQDFIRSLFNNENNVGASSLVNASEDYIGIPLIHIDSVGGVWSENALTSSEQFVERLIPFVGARKTDVAIINTGISMEPVIGEGSILHIRRVDEWREYFGYGEVFVLWLTDDRRITKRVDKYPADPDHFVICHSFNPEVEDERLPKDMIREVWKVINILTSKGW